VDAAGTVADDSAVAMMDGPLAHAKADRTAPGLDTGNELPCNRNQRAEKRGRVISHTALV
jgi:hypothetical protein